MNFRKRGEHPLARGEESRISGADVCVARAVEQFRCAFFFAGTRARKEREKEGRRNRAMSTTNLLTESGFFFFARVFGGFFFCARACNGLVETRAKRVSAKGFSIRLRVGNI